MQKLSTLKFCFITQSSPKSAPEFISNLHPKGKYLSSYIAKHAGHLHQIKVTYLLFEAMHTFNSETHAKWSVILKQAILLFVAGQVF